MSSIRALQIKHVVAILALIFVLPVLAGAQGSTPQKTAELMKNFTGEWIGTCEQSTNGEAAENKYFHAKFQQTGDDTFAGTFTYYRLDQKTGEPINIGETTINSTVQPDGTVVNNITGKGKMMVNNEPKDQEHKITEVLTVVDNNTLTGKIDGKISVSGLPLGVGKNGQIKNATSTWKLENGVMTIDQKLKAGFKVLMVSKSFDVDAHNVAKRGTDIVSLMKQDQLAQKPATKPVPGS